MSQQTKECPNTEQTENLQDIDSEDEEFMAMLISTLDENIVIVKDKIAQLDENDPEYDNTLKDGMSWLQFLVKLKEKRDGLDLSEFFQGIPANLRIY